MKHNTKVNASEVYIILRRWQPWSYASANFTPPPPRADPLRWMANSRGGDSGAVKSPGVETIKEGKCPVLRQHCNSFSLIAQSKSAILSILMWDFLFLLMSSFVIALGF